MSHRHSSRTWWPVPAAFGSLVLGAVLVTLILQAYVGAAYRFARSVGRVDIGAFDMLPQLGPSHTVFGACVMLVVLGATVTTLVSLVGRRSRRLAWTVPLIGCAVLACVGFLAVLTFQDPGPPQGG